jgi:hypothetical protein
MVYDGDLYKYLKEELKITEKNIDYRTPPPEVTYEMLKSSMGGTSRDFQLKIKAIEKDPKNMVAEALWSPYAKIMFPPNKFGLYVEKKGIKHMKFGIKITPAPAKLEPEEEVLSEQEVLLLEEKKNEPLPLFKPKKPRMYKQLTGGKITKKFMKNKKAGKKGRKTKRKGYKKGGIKFDKDYQDEMEGEWPILFMKENYPDPHGALRLYNPPGTSLYSMQIPNNNNRVRLFQQFAFMMYNKEIDTIIDLHSCGTGLHPTGRYPGSEGCFVFLDDEEKMNKALYINGERETWDFLKKMSSKNINNNNIQFWDDLEGVGVEDFTAGTLNGWFKLSEYPQINDPNRNKVAIHCQSGYGRSGTVALFYLLRDVFYGGYDIEKRFLGKGSSLTMFNYLEDILHEEFQKSEVFGNCARLFTQRLFLSRINYIILAISNYYKKKVFYLYLLPRQELPTYSPDKNIPFEELQEELQELTKEEIFIPILVDYERINTEKEIEVYLRRNDFLIGKNERKSDDDENDEKDDEEYDEEYDDADDYDQEIF